MAYNKLSQTLIDEFIDILQKDVILHLSNPFVFNKNSTLSIRRICRTVGICHMTYYRWIKEYKTIPADATELTHRQQLLKSFGDAIAKAQENAELNANSMDRTDTPEIQHKTNKKTQNKENVNTDEEKEKIDIKHWETLTAQLTGGTQCFEYKPKIHKKASK